MPGHSKSRATRQEVFRFKHSGEVYEIYDTKLARALSDWQDEITKLRAELDTMRKQIREKPSGI